MYLESIRVLYSRDDWFVLYTQLMSDPHSRKAIDPYRTLAIDIQELILARLAVDAGLVISREKTVQPGTWSKTRF
jgi:hypothetical protein